MAFSLPYGLKFIEHDEYMTYPKIHTLEFNGLTPVHHFLKDSFKPICRPLSDLTKPIEHNGEVFVPINKLPIIGNECINLINDIETGWIRFKEVQKLIEWHFDLAGLIEKGEAIDVNTLEPNPYK
jgi:hypothetical protein